MINVEDILNGNISEVKGIGYSHTKFFNKLGVNTVGDLIYFFPRLYDDRSNITDIVNLADGETSTVHGVVTLPPVIGRTPKGLSMVKCKIRDKTGTATITWFNAPYICDKCKPGGEYYFHGKIKKSGKFCELINPIFEESNGNYKKTCRIIPIYSSVKGLRQSVISAAIETVLTKVEDRIPEMLSGEELKKYNLIEINKAIKNIHFPESDEVFLQAQRRLIFDELFILQLGLFMLKGKNTKSEHGISFLQEVDMARLYDQFPFTLSESQVKVIEEIENDMKSSKRMNRLVQGDVGSGKTAVAAAAMYRAVKNGYQAAMMVPTEILAEQHFRTLDKLFSSVGIKTVLLKGGTGSGKKNVIEEIKSGDAGIIIGTHAIIQETVIYSDLGLVITDEQHRFGVIHRTDLALKGKKLPDVIVMSATPIPRTLGLILYGDLDISVIEKMPGGRLPVKTIVIKKSSAAKAYAFVRDQISKGFQAYIVCPLVDESDKVEAEAVTKYAETAKSHYFTDYTVETMHGKLSEKDKDERMRRFAAGKIDILIATTVIEVGIDVPAANVIIIENAERFGLSQLHQLRGRVGRGNRQSFCILTYGGNSRISEERMKVMQNCNNGFEISEKDLELRGPGDFFGVKQHGVPELKIADLSKDREVLIEARKLSEEIYIADPELVKPEHAALKKALSIKFGEVNGLNYTQKL